MMAEQGGLDGEQIDALQSMKLNGTQIASATKIISQVSAGEIPRDSGINQLQIFLGLTQEQAEQAMGDAGTGDIIKKDKVVNPKGAIVPQKTADKKKEFLNPETSEEELNGDNI
jgi:hypothetical protein